MQAIKLLLTLAFALLLAACGGGGGNPGGSNGGSGLPSPKLSIKLYNAGGVSTNVVTFAGSTTAAATLLDGNGKPVVGKIVTFSTDAALVKFLSPASGSVLTDANGVASIQISPTSLTAAGAATMKATTSIDGGTLTALMDFQLSAANIALQSLDVGTGTLAAYSNRPVAVTVTVDGVASSANSVQVSFTASCGSINPATAMTNTSGVAQTTYKADNVNCAGTNVTITASAVGATSAAGTIPVQAVTGSNLIFVSANPTRIYLTGSVGATQSMLSFKVIDASGSALANQAVSLSLTNTSAGTSIGSPGNTTAVVRTTDAAGVVAVPVFSGTVPTSVQVKAVLQSNSSVTTTSNVLTVASGRPVQSRASLSVETFALEGWETDGLTTAVTMRMADRQGNPVPDGTEVNFVAEGGYLVPASCTVSGGTSACSVQFTTSNPRPSGGRVSILAYVPGEEDFVDVNGNNVYDPGEPFTDLGNAYRDDNENSVYDKSLGEFVVPRAGAATCPGGYSGAPNTCDGVWGTVDARAVGVIVMASGTPRLTVSSVDVDGIVFQLADINGNSMPTGSTVAASARAVSGSSCAVTRVTPNGPIPNSLGPVNGLIALSNCNRPTPTPTPVGVTPFTGDIIDVTVTSKRGLVSTFAIPIL